MGVCDNSYRKVELPRSKSFFIVTKNNENQANSEQSSNDKVKLEFTIENCDVGQNYQVIAEFLNTNLPRFNTETVKSHQNLIIFNTCYISDFFFQQPQLMRISIVKNGNIIGSTTPYLGMIVGSPNSTYKIGISPDKRESISISAFGITNYNSFVLINFLIRTNTPVDFKNINNKISYIIISNGRKVYKSESISKDGQFKAAYIPASLLEPTFDIYFQNCRQETIVSRNETIKSFTEPSNRIYLSLNINNNQYNFFNQSQLLDQYSFLDYIKNGVQIELSIGIDFTSSNGNINDPNSLHYISPGKLNDYEQAIQSCGLILAYYDYDQLIPVYGFGAAIDTTLKPNMCFNINFKQDPNIHTIDNVLLEYRNCLRKIIFAGPTEFCPMIRKAIDTIKKENNPLNYHVLMILTDGVIVDQQQTIDAIIEASFLPFSLVIIGIGNDHFREMIELDGDDVPLVSSTGVKRMRDAVQFVPFNKYKNNPKELNNQVLEEIPKQIVDYYTMNKIYPSKLSMAIIRTQSMGKNNVYKL
jgi:hypothetical protein